MKHLKEYNNLADYEADYYGGKLSFPHVCVINGEVVYEKQYQAVQEKGLPFYVEAIEDLTVSLTRSTIQYSLDNEIWVDLPANDLTPTVSAGNRVYFRATNLSTASGYGIGTFSISSRCKIGGNIMSLVYGGDFIGKDYLGKSHAFQYLFRSQATIEDASKLVLPATNLSTYCYSNMFRECTNLISAPTTLPSLQGAAYAYEHMFYGCTSLVNAPKIMLTTTTTFVCSYMFYGCTSLVNAPKLGAGYAGHGCYSCMFQNCTSLVDAPELPATGLYDKCYEYMFSGCTSLVNAPTLNARTLTNYCYQYMFYGCTSLVNAPEINATTIYGNCFQYMFYGCTSLVNAPKMDKIETATSAVSCYQYMFYGCTSLVNAPEEIKFSGSGTNMCCSMFYGCTSLEIAPVLPTLSLSTSCYNYMFQYCSKLKYIKALFTATPSTSNLSNWVNGVPASGTFVKSPDATWENTFGVSAIPTGWTVEIAEAEA